MADRYSTPARRRFVAGSIGPSGRLPSSSDPELSNISFSELAAVFTEQAQALLDGDCDLLLIETSQDMLEVKAAVMGVQDAFARTGRKVPLQVQVTLDPNGRMLLGTDIAAVLATLERMPVDVIGINCATGPDHMRAPLAYLGEHCSRPISCLPNAGLPQNVDGRAVYPLAARRVRARDGRLRRPVQPERRRAAAAARRPPTSARWPPPSSRGARARGRRRRWRSCRRG